MLKFEPRFNVPVPALSIASKDSIERIILVNIARVSLTIIVEINPHRTTLNKSNTDN